MDIRGRLQVFGLGDKGLKVWIPVERFKILILIHRARRGSRQTVINRVLQCCDRFCPMASQGGIAGKVVLGIGGVRMVGP